jgi:hypothetical protein
MTSRPPRREGRAARNVESGPAPPTEPTQSPMERFRTLTKRLLNVSRKDVEKEHQKFNAANAARRRNKNRGA